ncbi:unnamed protein product [Spodoptera exigua]|nr:unnamed protein product [Spodoptera exigua]
MFSRGCGVSAMRHRYRPEREKERGEFLVSHAGHDVFDNQNENNNLKNTWSLYNSDGQIEHKLDLINNYIDKRAKLHLIGHSIGAWLLMELLHKNDYLQKRILSEKSMLLAFECMERIQELNISAIKKVQHMANVLYSTDDRWVPMHHIHDLQKFTPQIALHQIGKRADGLLDGKLLAPPMETRNGGVTSALPTF